MPAQRRCMNCRHRMVETERSAGPRWRELVGANGLELGSDPPLAVEFSSVGSFGARSSEIPAASAGMTEPHRPSRYLRQLRV